MTSDQTQATPGLNPATITDMALMAALATLEFRGAPAPCDACKALAPDLHRNAPCPCQHPQTGEDCHQARIRYVNASMANARAMLTAAIALRSGSYQDGDLGGIFSQDAAEFARVHLSGNAATGLAAEERRAALAALEDRRATAHWYAVCAQDTLEARAEPGFLQRQQVQREAARQRMDRAGLELHLALDALDAEAEASPEVPA